MAFSAWIIVGCTSFSENMLERYFYTHPQSSFQGMVAPLSHRSTALLVAIKVIATCARV
jgi:hypothetical protein